MPFNYSYNHPEPVPRKCPESFHEIRSLENRNRPAKCPECGIRCSKGIDSPSFNTVFAGSVRAEMLTDKAVAESEAAQAEGFTSHDEIQAAEGQAAERAKQLGIEPNRILGGLPSPHKPVEGQKIATSKEDAIVHESLIKRRLEAVRKKDLSAHQRVVREMKEHEKYVNKKAADIKTEFRPLRTKDDCKKVIRKSQEARKMKV